MGKELVSKIPDGESIAVIGGPLSDGNVVQVEEGLAKEIQGHLDIAYTARCENWIAAEAEGYVTELLERYPNISGIMCGNDDIATQVYQVLSANGLGGSIYLTGQDGDLMAFQRVAAGTQLVTAFKPVDEIARQAALCAVRMAQGQELPEKTDVISDGKYDIPYLELLPIGVTSANIDKQVIESGYHTRDEIYINK